MLSSKRFDEIIKNNLISSGVSKNQFGYVISGRDTYESYYSKLAFDAFVLDMKANYVKHYAKYAGVKGVTSNQGGKGGELVEKLVRGFAVPPKMASVASSSRFCYLALRDGTDVLGTERVLTKDDIEFEKECKIFDDNATAPQLDAYFDDGVYETYIEAKCHEIFSNHKIEFKEKYWNVFIENGLGELLKLATKVGVTFTIPKSAFGLNHNQKLCFDVKQLICHLLGIAKQTKGKKAKLIYMFFKPICGDTKHMSGVEEVFEKLSEEIKIIFNSKPIRKICEDNEIELVAITETSVVMEKLTKENMRYIYESDVHSPQ
jgi:hypothetical protein